MSHQRKRAFTLVELLVVIGIIALLIAILMPALSRARKQALQVSCGSNERQVTYGALAYANDWKEQLPVRTGPFGTRATNSALMDISRLPVIGFDSCTIWDWGSYVTSGYNGNWLGGFAFVMRDYLKNDFDIMVCPDGFYTKNDAYHRWNGDLSWQTSYPYYMPYMVSGLYSSPNTGAWGYMWLPHRRPSPAPTAGRYCSGSDVPIAVTDQPGDCAKTASDLPALLCAVDFNYFAGRYYAGCGNPGCSGCGVAANHPGTSNRSLGQPETSCMPAVFPPNIGRMENPIEMPLGQNHSRIDARTEWKPWQDWNFYRYCRYDGGSGSCPDTSFFSF